MMDKPSKTLIELQEQLRFFTKISQIDETELRRFVEQAIAGFRRVNTVNSLALVTIAEAALKDADECDVLGVLGAVGRIDTLRELAIFIGRVRIGWL